MKYAIINADTNYWEYESDSLADAKAEKVRLRKHFSDSLVLVCVLDPEPEDENGERHTDPCTALQAILDAAAVNSHPIHYKVREAIDAARYSV